TRLWRVLLHARALAFGDDLLREHHQLLTKWHEERAQLERQRDQGEFVVQAVIDRHYGGAKLPPPTLRTHVGVNDHALDFWAKGINSSRWVLDTFGTDPGGRILDWGCGPGRTLVWLRCHPAWRDQYHGCDVDREAIDWLRAQGEEGTEVCRDLPPLPYPDASFAGVFAFSVLTHIHPEHHVGWYRELHRVLAPGGRILVTTHGAWEVYERSAGFIQARAIQ